MLFISNCNVKSLKHEAEFYGITPLGEYMYVRVCLSVSVPVCICVGVHTYMCTYVVRAQNTGQSLAIFNPI